MRLRNRVADLEQRMIPSAGWVRIIQHEGQTRDEAIAAWEAERGPVGDRNIILKQYVSPAGGEAMKEGEAICRD